MQLQYFHQVELKDVVLRQMNATLNLNWETGELVRLHFGNIIEVAAEKIVRGLRSPQVRLSLIFMHFVFTPDTVTN